MDKGWIYVKFNDEYFSSSFISNIPKKYVKKIDNYVFVKKSKSVFNLLYVIGMDMSQYDSTIIIELNKENGNIGVKYESLQMPENLINIARKILENGNKRRI